MQDPHGIDILICRPGFTTFAMQTHAYRWSFVSDCAAELNPTEARIGHNNWHCGFAPCSRERGASRATDANNKHPQRRTDDYQIGNGTRQVMSNSTAAVVHEHASAGHNTLLNAELANATSQHTGPEVNIHSKTNETTTAAPSMEKSTTERGSASDCQPLAMSPWHPRRLC